MSALNAQPTYTQSELEAMTKTQLLELASSLNVMGVSSSSLKADIINAILAVF